MEKYCCWSYGYDFEKGCDYCIRLTILQIVGGLFFVSMIKKSCQKAVKTLEDIVYRF